MSRVWLMLPVVLSLLSPAVARGEESSARAPREEDRAVKPGRAPKPPVHDDKKILDANRYAAILSKYGVKMTPVEDGAKCPCDTLALSKDGAALGQVVLQQLSTPEAKAADLEAAIRILTGLAGESGGATPAVKVTGGARKLMEASGIAQDGVLVKSSKRTFSLQPDERVVAVSIGLDRADKTSLQAKLHVAKGASTLLRYTVSMKDENAVVHCEIGG